VKGGAVCPIKKGKRLPIRGEKRDLAGKRRLVHLEAAMELGKKDRKQRKRGEAHLMGGKKGGAL